MFFLAFLVQDAAYEWVSSGRSVSVSWMYPAVCVKGAQKKCVYVLSYSALSVTLELHSRVSYSAIMKGISWGGQIFCKHGCTYHVQINADQGVNK